MTDTIYCKNCRFRRLMETKKNLLCKECKEQNIVIDDE